MKNICKILVVDDDAGLKNLIQKRLERDGYEVVTVSRAEEALYRLKTEYYCFMLVDYRLPDMNASRFIDKLAEDGNLLPFVVMTGQGDERVAVELMKKGAKDYLIKDANFLELLNTTIDRVKNEVETELRLEQEKSARQVIEHQYELLINNANEAIFVVQNGIIVFTNPICSTLSGYSKDEIIGRDFRFLLFEDDYKKVLSRHVDRLAGKTPENNYSFRFVRKNNELRWAQINSVLFNWQGKPATLNFITDITEKRRTEEQIRASERRYRRMFESSPVPTFLESLEGRILDANRAACECIGYSVQELIGKKKYEIIPEKYHNIVDHNAIEDTSVPGEVIIVEYIRKDNSTFFAETSASLFDLDDRVCRIVFVRDISNDINTRNALSESERKYRTIFENIIDVFYRADAQGNVTLISPSGVKLLGYDSVDEIIGKNIKKCFSKDSKEAENFKKELFSNRQVVNYKLNLCKKDDTIIIIETTSKLIFYDEDNNIVEPPAELKFPYKGYRFDIEGIFRDITERVEAEVARRAIEARYRILVEQSHDAVFIVKDGKIVFVNNSFLRLSGYGGKDLYQIDFFRLIHPDDREIIIDRLRKRTYGETVEDTFEIRGIAKSGQIHNLEFSTAVIEYEGEKAIMGTIRDLSDKRKAEKEIEYTNELLQTVIDTSPNSIFVKDSMGRFILVNQKMADLHNASKEQLIGKTSMDLAKDHLLNYDQARRFTTEDLELLRTEKSLFNPEEAIYLRDGNVMYVQSTKVPLTFRGETGYLLGVSEDITDRKLAHDQLERSRNALAESYERYRRITDAITDYIYTVKVEDGIAVKTTHSDACKAVTGYSPREFDEDPYIWIKMVPPEHVYIVQKMIASVLKGQNPSPIEHRIKRKDGEIRWVRNTTVPHYNSKGEIISYDGLIRDITERRLAQEALAESEERLRTLLEDITNIAVVGFDENGIINFWNVAAFELYGYGQKYALGKSIYNLIIADENKDRYAQLMQESLKYDKYGFNTESKMMTAHSSSQNITVFSNTVLIRPHSQKPSFFRLDIDLTERYRAEKFMRIQRDLGVFLSSTSALDIALSKILEIALQIDGIDSGGIYLLNRHKELYLAKFDGITSEFANSRKIYPPNSSIYGLTMDGKPFYASKELNPECFDKCDLTEGLKYIALIPVQYRDEIVGLLNVASHDSDTIPESSKNAIEFISSEISAALGRIRAETELREQEELLRTTIDSITDIIFVLDNEFNLILFNRTFKKWVYDLGCNTDEMLGKNIFETCDHYNEMNKAEFEAVLTRKRTIYSEMTLEVNDSTRIIEMLKIPINWNGKIHRIVGLFRDVTERREMQDRLSRTEKMQAIGLLAGGVAHDLNNILTGVVSYPELILMSLEDDSPIAGYVKKIRDSGLRARDTVDDLLTLARRGVVNKETISINDIVKRYTESAEFVDLKYSFPNIQTIVSMDDSLLNIEGSELHIYKSLMNLVTNAYEAIVEEGIVTIRTYNRYFDSPLDGYDTIREGEYVILEVQDTGGGISKEDEKKIFEPFYTKKVMGRSGTGLGLAIVWGTIRDHRGEIVLNTQKDVGTKFSLLFPASRKEIVQKQIDVPDNIPRGNGETILIVDDVLEQREIASRILETIGYKTRSVDSGERAIEYMKQNDADLIILDIIMDPGIDGYDTYHGIIDVKPKQRALVVSGFSEDERVAATLALGASKYLRKPYILANLAQAVYDAIHEER